MRYSFFILLKFLINISPLRAESMLGIGKMPGLIGDKYTVAKTKETPTIIPKYVDLEIDKVENISIKKGQIVRISTKPIKNIRYWYVDAARELNYSGAKKYSSTKKLIFKPKTTGLYPVEIKGKPKKYQKDNIEEFNKKISIKITKLENMKIK